MNYQIDYNINVSNNYSKYSKKKHNCNNQYCYSINTFYLLVCHYYLFLYYSLTHLSTLSLAYR